MSFLFNKEHKSSLRNVGVIIFKRFSKETQNLPFFWRRDSLSLQKFSVEFIFGSRYTLGVFSLLETFSSTLSLISSLLSYYYFWDTSCPSLSLTLYVTSSVDAFKLPFQVKRLSSNCNSLTHFLSSFDYF